MPPGTPVALETGTVAFFVARELAALGCAPSVVDAREVRLKAHRPTREEREVQEGVDHRSGCDHGDERPAPAA